MSFVTHLEGAIDGSRLEARQLATTHKDRPLLVRYDLPAVSRAISRDQLTARDATMWRYRELLPVEHNENIVTLGEGMTPLLPCPALGAALFKSFSSSSTPPQLFIKDESQLPTGSFKSRGLSVAVSMAKELGVKHIAIPTAGNAGGALAAYAARAGLEAFVFMPEDTPVVNQYEAALFGARAFLVNGLITDCAKIIREGADQFGWFDISTLKEPYRIEGKKTMGLELAEQLNWRLPNHIFYPTGGGTGLIGMWKAFSELQQIGWLDANADKPAMHACQSTGCAPIPAAFAQGERFADPAENAHTIASGLRVPKAIGDFLILDAIRESGGSARAIDEDSLTHWMRLTTTLEGISLCPEAAACVGAVARCAEQGAIQPGQSVVIFNTGAAQKYVEVIETKLPTLDHNKINWPLIKGA